MKLLSKQALKLNITDGKQNRKHRSRLRSFNLAPWLTSCASSSKLWDLTNPWFPSLLKHLPPYRVPCEAPSKRQWMWSAWHKAWLTEVRRRWSDVPAPPWEWPHAPSWERASCSALPRRLLVPSPLLIPSAPIASGRHLPGIATLRVVVHCASCPSDDQLLENREPLALSQTPPPPVRSPGTQQKLSEGPLNWNQLWKTLLMVF